MAISVGGQGHNARRLVLVQPAAQRWGVQGAECAVADGVITHLCPAAAR